MDKILNLNKPKGITSHDLVDLTRKHYPNQKVGHAGTLDPLASGVLIVGAGKATKRLGELLGLEKEYLAKIVFGLSSPTDDLDSSDIKALTIPKIDTKQLSVAIESFKGVIKQRVPLYSATHYNGVKLYKRARNGEKIPFRLLPEKEVEVKKIELVNFKDKGFKFNNGFYPIAELRIVCSSGTYIRSIARDLGKILNTSGILSELTRTRIGEYLLKDSIKLKKTV